MTFASHLYLVPGRARWGVFHNLGTDEPVKYVNIHIAGRKLSVLWGGDRECWPLFASRWETP